ncbi:hypothetical protein [Aliiruegeria sabulilitoris]|uniref:hypothetical protein n=1 Tax=Aliiruegeria sabulilitoris TaxID=1510458 RepID=UPI0012E3BBA1|nr:hypothetical protein [Aliiruegeria sabulilitoris]NDR57451.1 hypothetical protein [Pseudoruegeria sp. M32A2M]
MAERVTVYSGEHEEFSRVVLSFGQEIQWTKQKTRDGYEIKFDREGLNIDTGQVFEKIPKDRLQTIRYDEEISSLIITVAPKVSLEEFLLGDKTLVMDFKNIPAEKPTEVSKSVSAAFPLGRPDLFNQEASFRIAEPSNGQTQTSRADHASSDRQSIPHSIYNELRAEVENANALGVVGVARPGGEHGVNDQTAQARTGYLAESSSHLSVHPGWQGDMLAAVMQETAQELIPTCFQQDRLDIASWSSDAKPEMTISETRSFPDAGLDELSDADVETLVKTYVSLGLGVEAIAIIKEFDLRVEGRELYLEMASIIDELERDKSSLFQGLGECDGPSALWAALATGEYKQAENFDYNSIQNWFMKLPTNLRELLGPRLSEFLWRHGEQVLFDAVHAATERVGDAESLDWWIVEGKRKTRSGDYFGGGSIFKESLPTSDDRAMVVMAEVLKTNGILGNHNRDDLELGEAILFEGKATEPPSNLLEELALGWFSVGNYGAAWNSWHRAESYSVSPEKRAEDFNKMVSLLLSQGEDFQLYLLRYDPKRNKYLGILSEKVRMKLASWAIENEEVSWAERLVSTQLMKGSEELSMLYSKIALKRKDYNLALSLVDGLEGESRSKVISDIYAAMAEDGDRVPFGAYVDQAGFTPEEQYGQKRVDAIPESPVGKEELFEVVEVNQNSKRVDVEVNSGSSQNEGWGSERAGNGITLVQAKEIVIESEKLRDEFGIELGG